MHGRPLIALACILCMMALPFTAMANELTAGDIDDNLNYAPFLDYTKNAVKNDYMLPNISFDSRVTINILDSNGRGVSNARVEITAPDQSEPVITGYSSSEGVFRFFPKHDAGPKATEFTVKVRAPGDDNILAKRILDLKGMPNDTSMKIVLEGYTTTMPANLDIMLVIDTTGSMTDELDYLTKEFSNITGYLGKQYKQISMRFGLVVYRDETDIYVVKSYNFTSSVSEMQKTLGEQVADDGGDEPEAVDKALDRALVADWRDGNTARMLFLVCDAPPHAYYYNSTMNLVRVAREKGIQIFPIAGSGASDTAEYMMRVFAALTNGRYIFLTDDSDIGNSHAEPKISCYQVTPLNDLFVRVVGSQLVGHRIEPDNSTVIRQVGDYNNGVCDKGNGTSGGGGGWLYPASSSGGTRSGGGGGFLGPGGSGGSGMSAADTDGVEVTDGDPHADGGGAEKNSKATPFLPPVLAVMAIVVAVVVVRYRTMRLE